MLPLEFENKEELYMKKGSVVCCDGEIYCGIGDVPRFLYINYEGRGCGAVLIDGKRVNNLQDINFHAHTKDENGDHQIEYFIQHYDKEVHAKKEISQGGHKDYLKVQVKVTGMEAFKNMVSLLNEIIEDTRIPEKVRNELICKITEVCSHG